MLTDTTHTGLGISVFLHLITTTSYKSEHHLNDYTCGARRVSSPLHMPVDTLEEQLTTPPLVVAVRPSPRTILPGSQCDLIQLTTGMCRLTCTWATTRTTPKATFTRTRLLEDSLIFTHVPKQ